MTDKRTTRLIAQAAVIAAIYVVLTIVFAPIAFEEIQVRIARRRWRTSQTTRIFTIL